MLIIPVDRITILLEQASGVEIPPLADAAECEATIEADAASDVSEKALANTATYRELAKLLEDLTPQEVYELLAVAIMGESDNAENSWDLAVQRAQYVAAENALDELARILVLTDAIEIGLGRLGYRLDKNHEAKASMTNRKPKARRKAKVRRRGKPSRSRNNPDWRRWDETWRFVPRSSLSVDLRPRVLPGRDRYADRISGANAER